MDSFTLKNIILLIYYQLLGLLRTDRKKSSVIILTNYSKTHRALSSSEHKLRYFYIPSAQKLRLARHTRTQIGLLLHIKKAHLSLPNINTLAVVISTYVLLWLYSTQYLNLTTNLTINKQQIELFDAKS